MLERQQSYGSASQLKECQCEVGTRNGEYITTKRTMSRYEAPNVAISSLANSGLSSIDPEVIAATMKTKFYYVYIIESIEHANRYYVGFTEDLEKRLAEHNKGKLPNTKRYAPWKIKSAHAFESKDKALAFETYLKSPSGRAFAKKRL